MNSLQTCRSAKAHLSWAPAAPNQGARLLKRAAVNAGAVTRVPPSVYETLGSPGQPLDMATRSFMEPRFGRDFSHVRVHADARAAESARAVNAHAYTVGREIVFDSGRYSTEHQDGQRLLAHELTHVAQQRSTTRTGQELQISDNPAFEREADTISAQIQADKYPAPGVNSSDPAIMREATSATPSPSGSQGKPDANLKGCKVLAGGRGLEHWAGLCVGKGDYCAGARHLYLDVFNGPFSFATIQGGPADSTMKTSGAWVDENKWESRGAQWESGKTGDECSPFIGCLKKKTAEYNAARHPYDPTSGPNSNSFIWWVLDQCGEDWSWSPWPYVKWNYWKSGADKKSEDKEAEKKG
jgi:Domain of unknown function (DUF4157)